MANTIRKLLGQIATRLGTTSQEDPVLERKLRDIAQRVKTNEKKAAVSRTEGWDEYRRTFNEIVTHLEKQREPLLRTPARNAEDIVALTALRTAYLGVIAVIEETNLEQAELEQKLVEVRDLLKASENEHHIDTTDLFGPEELLGQAGSRAMASTAKDRVL